MAPPTSACAARRWRVPSSSRPTGSCRATSGSIRTCCVIEVARLIRAHNLLVAAAGVLAGGWIALGALVPPKPLVFAVVAAVGLGAAGNALNDICDRAADRVNRGPGERPLAAGRVSRGTAELCVVGGTVAGLGAAGLVSGPAVLVGRAGLVAVIAHSPVLKRHGPVGNLAAAVIAGLPLMYCALAVGGAAQGIVPWT